MSKQFVYQIKCIYCGLLTKPSKEHVFPSSTIPEGVDAPTLTSHVCKDCNNVFSKCEQAFRHHTYISLLNAIARHTRTGEFISPVSDFKSEPLISGLGERVTIKIDSKYGTYVERMVAKIAFHTLLHNNRSQTRKEHYDYISFEDTNFRGDEDCFRDIRNFIRHGDKSNCKIQIHTKPMKLNLIHRKTQKETECDFSRIDNAIHVVSIFRIYDHYFASVGLFVGFYEFAPKYIISLCGELPCGEPPDKLKSKVDRVRHINFRNLTSNNALRDIRVDNSQSQSNLIIKIPNNNPMTGIINNWGKS